MSRKRNPFNASTRAIQAEKKRKKRDAANIKKAQTKLKQALALIIKIQGHYELDEAKKGICENHRQMSAVTKWLDGTTKEPLQPTIDTVFDDAIDVEAFERGQTLLLPAAIPRLTTES